VGFIDRERLPGLCLSAGMGARGISLSVLCGEWLAAELNHEPLPLPAELSRHVRAERYANPACAQS
jgi:tRNA 5-methylaminomethyl-2-thiouridine biosynthesis bifunctional protein